MWTGYNFGANNAIQNMMAGMVNQEVAAKTPASGIPTYNANLTGATPTGYTAASGGIPQMPNLQTTQQQAVAGNLATLPQLQQLAGGVNAFNLGEVTKQYQAGIPQYNAMTNQSSNNIMAALQGQVPGDVTNLLQQSAAERGIATGMPGSANTNAAYLRALGLTSLGQQQYGEQALSGAVARMPKTGLYNVAGDMVTPEQQQQAQYMANVLAASPIPQAAYNQAIAAAMMGQNRGYNTAAMQTVPGMTASASSPAASIAAKYQTVPGSTGAGYFGNEGSGLPTSPAVRTMGGWNDNPLYGQSYPNLADPNDPQYAGIPTSVAQQAAAWSAANAGWNTPTYDTGAEDWYNWDTIDYGSY